MPAKKPAKAGGGGSIRDVQPKSDAYRRIEEAIEKAKADKAAADHEAAVQALADAED